MMPDRCQPDPLPLRHFGRWRDGVLALAALLAALGRSGEQPALQTCLVGRGVGESGPTAAVLQEDLSEAVARWRSRRGCE
jgi:hypothetical protein